MSSLPHDPAESLLARFLASHSARDSKAFEAWARAQPELAGDAALLARVERLRAQVARNDELLGGGASGGGFFGRGGARREARNADDSSPGASFTPGQRVGTFTLRRFLSQGGMGQVWEAYDEELRRPVALKFVRPDQVDARALERFEREARAGGRLNHPSIVRTLAFNGSGNPAWIAQELVEGSWTLKDFLDELRAEDKTPEGYYRKAAELVASLAEGLEAAHQAGVIHRDIKPQNILIAPDDSPKLTDFGLARVSDDSFLSVTGEFAGTYAYMSPEQVTAKRIGLDHRSDIFSLGVVLYELLSLRRPFEGDTTHQISQKILFFEPPEPSKVRSQCPRELSIICGKALEKDPDRRYPTMAEFAADLRRHLKDEPIHARPPGTLVRVIKWARRNPGPSSAAAVGTIALAVISGLLVKQVRTANDLADSNRALEQSNVDLASQTQRAEAATLEAQAQQARAAEQEAEARKQEAHAREQEAEARKQAATAKAVAKFQTDMLAAVDPSHLPLDPVTKEPLRDAVTVVQAMQAAVEVLDEGSLKDQPLVEAEVRDTIGETLMALDRYAEAEPNLRKSLQIRRDFLPAGHPDIADGLNDLALLLTAQNKGAEAEPLFRELLDINRAALPAGHPDIATGLHNLALLLQDQNKLAEAEPLYREALQIWRASLPAGDPDIATAMRGLASLLRAQNKLAEAEPLLRDALQIYRAALPAGHPDIAGGLNSLAMLLRAQNRLAEAEPLAREALEIRRAALPAEHPDIARGLNMLASLLQDQNKLAEAEPLFREALEINRTALPAGHPDIAPVLNNLAQLLQNQNRLAEAEPLFREALENLRAALPAAHPNIARGLNSLAMLLRSQNRLAEAEPFLREALEIRRAALPEGHPDIAKSLNTLALLLQDQNKLAEAEPLFREALEINRTALPAGHPDIAPVLNNLALLLWFRNRLAEAEPLFREALEINRTALPAAHPNIARALSNLGQLLQLQNKLAEAEPLFHEALEINRAALPAGHPDLLTSKRSLADLYANLGKAGDALPLFRELFESSRATLPKDSPELASQIAQFCQKLLTLRSWVEAEPLLRECLTIRENTQPDSWLTFNTRSLLGGALLGQSRLTEAEPLLLAGYQGMKEREAAIPPVSKVRITDALERLVKLYEAQGNEPEAASWRSKLDAARAAVPTPPESGGKR